MFFSVGKSHTLSYSKLSTYVVTGKGSGGFLRTAGKCHVGRKMDVIVCWCLDEKQ